MKRSSSSRLFSDLKAMKANVGVDYGDNLKGETKIDTEILT